MYSKAYELVHKIALDIEENMIGGMALAHGGKYLICTHQQGLITIINTEDYTLQTVTPFGEDLENIWNVKAIEK